MTYYRRIMFTSVLLALLTALVIIFTPRAIDVLVLSQSPTGDQIPAGASIRITFSRAVDHRSAESHFTLIPVVTGRFSWTEQTLTFKPNRPLASSTLYHVVIQRGLHDVRGSTNQTEIAWTFRTRPIQLLLASENTFALANADGSNLREVATIEGTIGGISVAPDGSQIAYTAIRDERRSALMLLNLADGTSRPLADSPDFSAANPVWAPIGDYIAFERSTLLNNAVGPPHIWLAQPDGTSIGSIGASDAQEISFGASWAPDGSRLSFTDGLSQTLTLFTFSGNRTSFPDSTGEPASWAPDGRSLVYGSYGSQTLAPKPVLRRAQIGATGEPPIISAPPDGATSPAWSPDGQSIAYIQHDAQGRGTIWLLGAAGSPARQLTTATDGSDQQPTWSPDSTRIAFLRIALNDARSAAWIVPVTGGAATLLREHVSQTAWVP